MLSKTILSKQMVTTEALLPKLPSTMMERLKNESEDRKQFKRLVIEQSNARINIADPIKLSKMHLKENILKAY